MEKKPIEKPELLVTVSDDDLEKVATLSSEEIGRALQFGKAEREAAEANVQSVTSRSRVRFR